MSTPPPTLVTDRLHRLADQAPSGVSDPDVLWTQGRRRQRARWAGTAACLVVLAVLGAGAVPPALQRTQGLVAVSPDAGLRLPDVIRQPGEWEPAFPSAPGRLVAVGFGTRGGWWSSRNAWWGVSAATGESRFLELSDAVTSIEATPALSADGRRLAYWITGETLGEPLMVHGLAPAVGVAVVDLVTGDVERWRTGTRRGMATYGLAWAGDVLWWAGGDYSEDSTPTQWGSNSATYTWDVGTGEQLENGPFGAVTHDLAGRGGSAPDGLLLPRGRRNVLSHVTGDGTARPRPVRPDVSLASSGAGGPTLSPDGTRLAGTHDLDTGATRSSDDSNPLVVGEISTTTTEMERVGDVATTAVLGWRSPDEVVIERYAGAGIDFVYGASVVDVDTAEVTPLIDFRGNVPSFAADAWSADVIEAPDAPWAPDPRLLGVAVLVVGTFLVSLFNSVRRRRGHP